MHQEGGDAPSTVLVYAHSILYLVSPMYVDVVRSAKVYTCVTVLFAVVVAADDDVGGVGAGAEEEELDDDAGGVGAGAELDETAPEDVKVATLTVAEPGAIVRFVRLVPELTAASAVAKFAALLFAATRVWI